MGWGIWVTWTSNPSQRILLAAVQCAHWKGNRLVMLKPSHLKTDLTIQIKFDGGLERCISRGNNEYLGSCGYFRAEPIEFLMDRRLFLKIKDIPESLSQTPGNTWLSFPELKKEQIHWNHIKYFKLDKLNFECCPK